MNEFDVAFELILPPKSFDEDSDKLVASIFDLGSKSEQFSDVHAGGEAATGLLDVSIQVRATDLSAATATAYALLMNALKSSSVKADIRNQTAVAV